MISRAVEGGFVSISSYHIQITTIDIIYLFIYLFVFSYISGALGVMFEYGIGVKKNSRSAFKCLKESAMRGNVYAQGNLAVHYYKRKLFNKAADVAKR